MTEKADVKQVYRVYVLKTDGLGEGEEPTIEEIAFVDGDAITGSRAEDVRRMLERSGWPTVPPDQILWGDYVWAEKAPKIVAGK